MMLKVEAYASGRKLGEPCQPPLHICLATTAALETGICLTVGRKEGLVQFTEDKTVSRKDHCVFRFVSSSSSSSTNGSSSNKAASSVLPPPCQTPEQKEAADACLHQLAVVLENQGKRTIVVKEPDPNSNAEKKKKPAREEDDSATAGSEETADEGDHGAAAFESQASLGGDVNVLSIVGKEILGNDAASQVKLDVLLPDQSRVLVPLSRPNGRVIIQCGRLGSTLLITRVDTISFVKSSLGKKKMPWMDRLDWFGAHEITNWTIQRDNNDDENKVNLLVTAKRDPSVKQLAAWSLRIPAVTPGYMEALLARTDPAEPLPDPKDYQPPQPTSGNLQFWKKVIPDPNLLQGATCISTKAGDEVELLVAAAGADVWKLYQSESPEQDLNLLKGCFGVDQPRRKLNDVLKKRGIPLVSMRTIAQAITEQNPTLIGTSIAEAVASFKREKEKSVASLEATNNKNNTIPREMTIIDTKGGSGGGIINDSDDEQEEIGLHQKRKARPGKPPPALENSTTKHGAARTSDDEEEERNKHEKGKTVIGRQTAGKYDDDDAPGTKPPPRESASSKRTPSTEAMDVPANGGDDDGDVEIGGSSKKQRTKSREEDRASSSSSGSKKETSRRTGGVSQQSQKMQESKKTSTQHPTASSQSSKADERNAQLKPNRKHSRLSSGAGGWLEVAPKEDKKRRALVRSDHEIQEIAGYDTVLPRAITKKVSGMVGQPQGQQSARAATTKKQLNHTGGVPDFRAFRKNVVAGASSSQSSSNNYRLRLHRPKESAGQQYEFEEQRQALEEQQRRTDALFRDTGARTGASRRRR